MSGAQRGSNGDRQEHERLPEDFEPMADEIAFVAIGIALRRCFRFAIFPDQLAVMTGGGRFDQPCDRLEALVGRLLSDIGSMPDEGFPDTRGTPGQMTAIPRWN